MQEEFMKFCTQHGGESTKLAKQKKKKKREALSREYTKTIKNY